ncbi:oligosaccharide flippase family protein [Aeromicrobium sp. SMF47]|uniref:oligosaccharide flippase family protein n=1 Tax=Aeromicrobium yanjiei TaxID=2662028 RepID=UPI00129ECB06|nr:polysaccharide biosynthesis C-terminal domain-containing protein [Aeromicrobium yanjiei]MRJ76359.1 oligosaccharide flippase family protein [Aeromicrobium yanjiei]
MAEPGTRGIAWAGAVNLVGGAAGSVVGLLLAAVVGRELGTEGAGTYFLVVAVFMIVSNVAELGADTGLVRFVSAARATGRSADVPHLVRTALRPVVLGGVLVVAVAAATVRTYPGAFDGLSSRFVVGAAALAVLSSLIAVMLSVSRGLGDVLTYPLLQNIALPFLRLGAVFAVVSAGGGVAAVLTAWMAPVPVVLVLATLVAVMMLRRHAGTVRGRPARPAELRRASGEFWTFSATRGVTAAVEILLEWVDVLIVGALTSAEEAGVYAVVTRCARAGEVIQQAARIAVGPQISAALARGAVHEAREIYGLVTSAMIWLAWPFFVVLAVFGDAVLSLFGPGFDAGWPALATLAVAMGLATAAGTVQTILLMGGRSTWQLADKSGALALNVALNLVLVPMWGIEGAAVAWAVTILVDTAVVVYQVQHLMDLRPQGRPLLVAAALSLALTGSLCLAARLVLGSSVPVMLGTVVVVAAVYLGISFPLRHRLGLVDLVAHRSR